MWTKTGIFHWRHFGVEIDMLGTQHGAKGPTSPNMVHGMLGSVGEWRGVADKPLGASLWGKHGGSEVTQSNLMRTFGSLV